VKNRPVRDFFARRAHHGVLLVAFPLWVTFVASTLTFEQIVTVPMPLWPGDHFLANYTQVLTSGSEKGSSAPVSAMLVNSLIMACRRDRENHDLHPVGVRDRVLHFRPVLLPGRLRADAVEVRIIPPSRSRRPGHPHTHVGWRSRSCRPRRRSSSASSS
jgi:hypothetical protein